MLQSILNLFIDKITNSNKLQEKVLLNNICRNIIVFSPFIKYVGIIDRDGKLITGLYKEDYLLTLINNHSLPFYWIKFDRLWIILMPLLGMIIIIIFSNQICIITF